jgi:hypothetical protein
VLQRVVRREPENINAWLLLEIVTYGFDQRTNVLAEERVRDLAGRARR